MNFLSKLPTGITKKLGKAEILIEKRSPEILLALGLMAFAGTVIVACKETLKASEVIEEHNKKMKDIEDAKNIAEEESEYEYDLNLYKRDKVIVYTQTTVGLVKTYAPSAALAALSVTCLLSSRNIMQKRYLGVVAAYNAVSEAFEAYRKRVRDEVGVDMDRHYRYGTSLEDLETVETLKNGKTKETTEKIENADSNLKLPSDSSKFFDASNPNHTDNPELNLFFLRAQQNIANDIFRSRGHIFLNEVYDMLGFEHTSEGAVVGWVEGLGDNCVDFGLYDQNKDSVRRFVNGKENVVLLEFNHDGVIWDKIG